MPALVHRLLVPVLVAAGAGILAPAAPVAAAASCGNTWGSTAETLPLNPAEQPIKGVRTGRHECFDRLVIDLVPAPGYDVRYVHPDTGPLRGAAGLQVKVGAPIISEGWPGYRPANPSELSDVSGYRTFRQVSLAGADAESTTIALGVRARLPFRVFLLGSRNDDFRLVVDVAHRWIAPTCAWRADRLPTGAGTGGGRVDGTDGGDRWVGIAGDGAALWQGGRLTPLGPGRARDVNREGTVVGADQLATGSGHAAIWVGGRRSALTEPPGVTRSEATAINDSGLIVGWGVRGSAEDQDGPVVGLVWSRQAPGRVSELGFQGLDVMLSGVSDDGVLFGNARQPGVEEGAVTALRGTTATGLRPLNPSMIFSQVMTATGGYAAGTSASGGTVWRAGSSELVRTRPGLLPTGVNRHGDVTAIDTGYRPVLWSGDDVIALPVPSGWSGGTAWAVDDAGRVGGQLRGGGGDFGHPVLWACRAT